MMMMMMHKAFPLRDDIHWLYVSKKEGGRRIAMIKGYIVATISGLKKYIKKNKERLITPATKKSKERLTPVTNINGRINSNRKTTKTRKLK